MALPENFTKHRWTTTSTPKRDSWKGVILRDFDVDMQRRIQFHPGVCASFFDNLYTDEDDAELAWLSSPANDLKRREVKYGNNIAVLFKALYQFRDFHKWQNFWPAIAKGWKANAGCVEVVINILAQARRIYRQRPDGGRPACQTAQAADMWIDYLDSPAAVDVQRSQGHAGIIFPAVKEFYAKMERKMVNAGRVPRDCTQASPPSTKAPVAVGGSVKKEGHGSEQQDDRRSVDRSTRKRSRSRSSSECPTSKRPHHGAADGHHEEQTTSIAPPKDQDTHSQPVDPHASPPVSSHGPVSSDETPQSQDSSSEENPPEASPKLINGCSTATHDLQIAPESRATAVELVATAGALLHLQHANEDIKENVASLRSNLESLTDSLALIVDHVESVRHDVNELKKQQEQQQAHSPPSQDLPSLEALLQKCAAEVGNLKADIVGLKIVSDSRQQKQEESQQQLRSTAASNLELMQEMTTYVQTMMRNLADLKSQPQPAPSPPPVQLDAIKTLMEGLLANHESKVTSQVESLLVQRDEKIKTHIENLLPKQQDNTPQIEEMLAKHLARVHTSIEERITERDNALHSRMKQDMIQLYIDKIVAKPEQRVQPQSLENRLQCYIDKLVAELKPQVQPQARPQIGEDVIRSYINKTVTELEQRMQSRVEEVIQMTVTEREQRMQPQIDELLTLAQQGSKIQAKFEDVIAQQYKVEGTISQQEAKLEKILTQQSSVGESISEHESETRAKMTTFFREQNGRLDKLRDELSSIKNDMARVATSAKPANPQTMREAMQLAVTDMKQHQEKVQRFYNRLSLIGGRDETAQLADFLVKLDFTLLAAQACGITANGSL